MADSYALVVVVREKNCDSSEQLLLAEPDVNVLMLGLLSGTTDDFAAESNEALLEKK